MPIILMTENAGPHQMAVEAHPLMEEGAPHQMVGEDHHQTAEEGPHLKADEDLLLRDDVGHHLEKGENHVTPPDHMDLRQSMMVHVDQITGDHRQMTGADHHQTTVTGPLHLRALAMQLAAPGVSQDLMVLSVYQMLIARKSGIFWTSQGTNLTSELLYQNVICAGSYIIFLLLKTVILYKQFYCIHSLYI